MVVEGGEGGGVEGGVRAAGTHLRGGEVGAVGEVEGFLGRGGRGGHGWGWGCGWEVWFGDR